MSPNVTTNNDTDFKTTQSLDPVDWESFRELAHQLMDVAINHLEHVDKRPVWQPLSDQQRRRLIESLDSESVDVESAVEFVQKEVLPFSTGNTHPGFFGWVHGTGTPTGMLAELIAGAMNCNVGGREHAAVYIEQAVIEWTRKLFELPANASGILLSGTSMATLVGLAVARTQADGIVQRRAGIQQRTSPLVGYTSRESHSSVAKAFEMLGIGSDFLRTIPTDGQDRLVTSKLESAIRRDLRNGLQPFAVIATAGTVNTGAIDPLEEIAELCNQHSIWLHVDAAFGAALALHPQLKTRLAGIDRANSIAFDFHKWMHVNYDAGCLMVRDGQQHLETFRTRPAYLEQQDGGLASAETWFCDYGPELSRGFRALKVWLTIKQYGAKRLGEKVQENCEQAQWLAQKINASAKLELLAPVPLNIVCFRYRKPNWPDCVVDRLNQLIVSQLHLRGIAAPSTTQRDGKLAIRACLTNHRTEQKHLQTLIDGVLSIGDELTGFSQTQRSNHCDSDRSQVQLQNELANRLVQERLRRERCNPNLASLVVVDLANEQPLKQSDSGQVILGREACFSLVTLYGWTKLAVEWLQFRQTLQQRNASSESGQGQDVDSSEIEFELELAALMLACKSVQAWWSHNSPDEKLQFFAVLPDAVATLFSIVVASPQKWNSLFELPEVLRACSELFCSSQIELNRDFDLNLFDSTVIRASEFAIPIETLLVTGGDDRLFLDRKTETNRYGCSVLPDDELASFSSSTATTIDSDSFEHLVSTRHTLIRNALQSDANLAGLNALESIRKRLSNWLGLARTQCDIILAPSGTDCELVSVWLAARNQRELTNVLVAPDESGSGLLHAAKGAHFSKATPRGRWVEPGDPLNGFEDLDVTTKIIRARDDFGSLLSLAEIDWNARVAVERSLGENKRCLIHRLACSKTGWCAPSMETLIELKNRNPKSIEVVVDCCQLRQTPQQIQQYLQAGFMVQLTGSKFFAGPAFSGALLVPANVARASQTKEIPPGIMDQVGSGAFPSHWNSLRPTNTHPFNLGMVFRWEAALEQIEKLSSLPSNIQVSLFAEMSRLVERKIEASPCCVRLDQASIVPHWGENPAVESNDGLVPFLLRISQDSHTSSFATFDQAKHICQAMRTNLSQLLRNEINSDEREIVAKRIQLGQPVRIKGSENSPLGALRFCLSARHITKIANNHSHRLVDEHEKRQLVRDIEIAFEKLRIISRHWLRIVAKK